MPRPSSMTMQDVGGRPRSSSSSSRWCRCQRRRRPENSAGRGELAPAPAVTPLALGDDDDDAATGIHPWAPTWSSAPVGRAASKVVSRPAAIPVASGWQRQHLSVARCPKWGLLEAAVVAASRERAVHRVKNNNIAGSLQVPGFGLPCLSVSCHLAPCFRCIEQQYRHTRLSLAVRCNGIV